MTKPDRIAGLDTIRFVCALWVVFSHFGFIPISGSLVGNGGAMAVLRGLYNNLFCGVAAVIVFFVISGFCIHFPFRNSGAIPVRAFLARRYLRIGIPVAMVFSIVFFLRSAEITGFYNAILWSLVAELVYYTIYPALFPIIKNHGWCLIIGANLIAFFVISLHPRAKNYHEFGPYFTWIVGLPCWLLGCQLANLFSFSDQPPGLRQLWFWRFFIWFLAVSFSVLRFHSPVGFPWTLNFFAIACFFWLHSELRWFQTYSPCQAIERAGAWSYSLYLCHFPVFFLVAELGIWLGTKGTLSWFLEIVLCLLVSYVFFLMVEYPAHLLARHVARILRA